MKPDLASVLGDYVAAWNEPDAAARERLLSLCVTDDVARVADDGRLEEIVVFIGDA